MTIVSEQFDRLKGSLAGFIKTVTNRIDYLALYPGVVVKQNADKTLQVKPDDLRMPRAMDKLQIRHGIPGTTVTVRAGTRVLVGFGAGDPSLPYAALWDSSGTVVELSVVANTVNVGPGSMHPAGLGDALTTALGNISTWLTTHTHPVSGAVAGASALPAPTIPTVQSGSVNVGA